MFCMRFRRSRSMESRRRKPKSDWSRRVYAEPNRSMQRGGWNKKDKADMVDDIKVEVGSGNVFADLGLPNPEESLAKAELASRIGEVIRQRRLTQAAAAEVLG